MKKKFILQESEEENPLTEVEINDRKLVNEDGSELTDKDLEECLCGYEVNIMGHGYGFDKNSLINNEDIKETEDGFEIDGEKYIDVKSELSLATYELVLESNIERYKSYLEEQEENERIQKMGEE